MTPHNYTAWGLRDSQRDTTNPGFGSMLGRLFLRTLPQHYTSDSTYTWFPLMTPSAMEKFTTQLGVRDRYSFDRPTPAPVTHIIDDYPTVAGIMKDVQSFRPPYADRVGAVVKGQGYDNVGIFYVIPALIICPEAFSLPMTRLTRVSRIRRVCSRSSSVRRVHLKMW